MRFAVLADIHGNLPALEAILADLAPLHPDGILVAGDHVNGGPFPAETLAALQAANCEMIRGNHEDYLADYSGGRWPAEKCASPQWGAVRWVTRQIGAPGMASLAALPEQRVVYPAPGGTFPAIRMVHGTLQRANQGLLPENDPLALAVFEQAGLAPADQQAVRPAQALAQIDENVLICGHTHIPWIEPCDGKLALNPGSAGMPLGGVDAQYALLTWQGHAWQAELRRVPYDLDRVRRAYRQRGLDEAAPGMARACLANMASGLNVAWFFVLYAYRLARARNAQVDPVIPDALWAEACRSFPWQRYEP